MNQEQRIRDLEDAVLHLAQAVNRLIEWQVHEKTLRPIRSADEQEKSEDLMLESRRLAQEAYKAVASAVDSISMEHHEQ